MDLPPPDNAWLSKLNLVLAATIVAVLVLAMVMWWLRRRRYQRMLDTSTDTGFTLADVRRMYESGQISEQEFKALKKKVIQASGLDLGADAEG